MTLSELTALCPGSRILGSGDPQIERVDYDSRRVRAGSLFVAISGEKSDGHYFLKDARVRGAVAAAVAQIPSEGLGIPIVQIRDTRRALAIFSGAVAGHPDRRLALIGITGTNGKTTTAMFLADILSQSGRPTGLISTVGTRIGAEWLAAERTTPESPDIYYLLSEMTSRGCTDAVMEVSSHALQLERTFGLKFKAVAFTNLTQDHLDFHGNMKSYFQAKARLFRKYEFDAAVINIDDPYGQRLMSLIKQRVMTYSLTSNASVRATNLKLSYDGLTMSALTPRGSVALSSPLVGKFNAYNLLCALAVVEALELPQEAFVAAARGFGGAPGRMQRFDLGERWVYVDYAHTPDALRQALAGLREIAAGPLHVLFGCGGNRDRAKRPLMGQAAEESSDRIYVTTDNPRDEEAAEIAAQILAGMAHPERMIVNLDRRIAIRQALEELPQRGVLLIAGKGHENYQEIRGVNYPFDDSKEVQSYLAEAQ